MREFNWAQKQADHYSISSWEGSYTFWASPSEWAAGRDPNTIRCRVSEIESLIASYGLTNIKFINEELEPFVAMVSQRLEVQRAVLALPKPAVRHRFATNINKATETLRSSIAKAPPAMCREISMLLPLGGVRLSGNISEDADQARAALDDLLLQLIQASQETVRPASKPGARPRIDLVYLAAAMMDLWQHLSARKFPANTKVMRARGADREGGGEEEFFKSESARFIQDAVRIFDSRVTLAKVKTAMKSVAR